MIGVRYETPAEFRYREQINEEKLPHSTNDSINSLDQDDLYVDMTFAKLWHANLAARRALKNGVKVVVPTKEATAPKLEIWNNYGSPPERISISDTRWKFHGEWTKLDRYSVASREDVEASVSFYDTGAILTGTSSKGSKIRIQDIAVFR